MIPDLTTMLQTFMGVFKSGRSALLPDAMGLLKILAAITITWSALMWALSEGDVLKEFVKKVIFIGAFVYLVTSFSTLVPVVVDGFIYAGTKAGGSSNTMLIYDPSAIIGQGLIVIEPIFQSVQEYSGAKALLHLPTLLTTWVCGLLVILSYILLAVQVFITLLEFGIVSTLSLILLPFGVWKPTNFIAEKAIGAIISFGVKLMVLAFVISVGYPIMEKFAVPLDPSYNQLFTLVAACLVMVGLAWHAPGVAAGLLAGAPTLTAQTAAGVGLGVGAGAAGGAIATRAAAAGVPQAARAAANATRTAASMSGAVSALSEMHGGGMKGAVKGGGALAAAVTRGAAKSAVESVTEAYGGGAQKVGAMLGKGESSEPSGGGKGGEEKTAPPAWAKRLSSVAVAKTAVQSAIPPEASPSGGVAAPINDPEKGASA